MNENTKDKCPELDKVFLYYVSDCYNNLYPFNKKSPLLQLLLGIFTTVGFIRLFMFLVDFIEDRREGKR